MKKLLSLIIIPLLLAAALYIPGYAKVSGTTNDVEIEIIAPEQIVNPVEFTVYARITNYKDAGTVKLKNAAWKVNGKEFKQDINNELSPADKSKEKLEELKNKTELTPEDEKKVKEYQDKLDKATCLLSFDVTEDMAKQIKDKGSSEISLSIQGVDMNSTQIVKAAKGTVVTSGALQRLTYVPTGFNVNNLKFGDTHTHSTQSREFLGLTGTGIYSISQLKSQAITAGLQWMVLTDHAYCMDSNTFNTQKGIVTGLCDNNFAFLYGEELSVAENAGDTGHMNGIMNFSFISCQSDSLTRVTTSPTASEGINYIEGLGGLVTINHPGETTSFLGFADANYGVISGETGIEIINGDLSVAKNTTSINSWVNKLLLAGQRAFPFAGSDTEDTNNLGKCFNVVYTETLGQQGIRDSLEAGHYYASTGPALALWAKNSTDASWGQMGDEIAINGKIDLYLSYAYGKDMTVSIVKGYNGKESSVIQSFTTNRRNRNGFNQISVTVEPGCYIRAYCVETTNTGKVAYTTPIWFK